jgi:hypothetical protein
MEYAESRFYLCNLEERAYKAFRRHIKVTREHFHEWTLTDPLIQKCFHDEFVRDYLGQDENWKLWEPNYMEFKRSLIVYEQLNEHLYGSDLNKDGWSIRLHWACFGYRVLTGIRAADASSRLPLNAPKSFRKALYYLLVFLTHQWIINNHPEDMPAL